MRSWQRVEHRWNRSCRALNLLRPSRQKPLYSVGCYRRARAAFDDLVAEHSISPEDLIVEIPNVNLAALPAAPPPIPTDRELSPEEMAARMGEVELLRKQIAERKAEALRDLEKLKAAGKAIQKCEQQEIVNDFLRQMLTILKAQTEFSAWQERFRAIQQVNTPRDPDRSISAAIKSFLLKKRNEAQGGGLSSGRADALRTHLEFFEKWIGGGKEVSNITSRTIDDFHGQLMKSLDRGEIRSRSYGRDLLASTKQFVRWCWTTERLPDLPRNIDDRSVRIQVGVPSKEFFTTEEVRSLLAAAVDRTKLYILLMLNCGMTQVDVSDLQQTQVDWRKGRIRRRRSKTENHERVPVVDYLLWGETFALLRQFRSNDQERVLLNKNGAPLKSEYLVDGKLKKTDAVRNAYFRLAREKGVKKPAKLFRKTSANFLKSNPRFASLADYFLGHAPRSVGERHYYTPSTELFDEALKWLGNELLKPSTAKKKSRKK